MKTFLLILITLVAVSGVVGFSVDFAATSFLRVMFLITADILVITLVGRLFFRTENGKIVRKSRVRVS